MMNSPAGRLTAREIIAKTFSAKARRGYDPAEVDAYLMDVARQVDELNLEIDRLTNEVVRLSFSQPTTSAATPSLAPTPSPAAAPPPPVAAELPPPPPPTPEAPQAAVAPVTAERVVAEPVIAAPVAAAPVAAASTSTYDSTAADESLKLILKAAQRTAEQTITDARTRAEEIIAEARYRASEITRESDRKAFEAASRIQTEIVNLEDQLAMRRGELESLHRSVESERLRVRAFAHELLRAAGEDTGSTRAQAKVIQLEPAPSIDLTSDSRSVAREG